MVKSYLGSVGMRDEGYKKAVEAQKRLSQAKEPLVGRDEQFQFVWKFWRVYMTWSWHGQFWISSDAYARWGCSTQKIVTGTSYFHDYFWPFMWCSLFMTEIISKPAKKMYVLSWTGTKRPSIGMGRCWIIQSSLLDSPSNKWSFNLTAQYKAYATWEREVLWAKLDHVWACLGTADSPSLIKNLKKKKKSCKVPRNRVADHVSCVTLERRRKLF